MKNIAIITGASSGFGKEFVYQVAAKYESIDEIWVIARRKERLEELRNQVSVNIVPMALDLTKDESFDIINQKLEEEKPNIKVLVNASGFGYFKAFTDRPLDDWMRLIDLNDKALVKLNYLSIPYMQSGAHIYNIASTSAFQPVPYINVYAASKAFVLSFSRGLNVELKEKGIKVIAVCPHWTKTEFFDTAVVDDTIKYYNTYNTPTQVVSAAINNMKKGKDVSLVGAKVKNQIFLVKHFSHKFVMKTWCNQQKFNKK